MSTSHVHVYIATSIDGFIAGPNDDLSWLHDMEDTPGDDDALTYEDFIDGVGALLMGRRTYDVVRGFDIPWPYGDLPILVATTRDLDPDPPATVQSVEGPIAELISSAKEAAKGRHVYLDGGVLIRQAAEADLIDEITITIAPVALGEGYPLFAGLTRRYAIDVISHHRFRGGMIQIRARPRRGDAS